VRSFNLNEVLIVRELQDRVARTHTKHCHKANNGAQREADARDGERHNAANQAEGDIGEYEPSVGAPMKGTEQQHDDQHERNRGVQQQLALGLRFAFGSASELDEDATRQSHVVGNLPASIVNDAAQAPARGIECHADAPLPAIMLDAVAVIGRAQLRHLLQRNGPEGP
jgi:hypothetical protein